MPFADSSRYALVSALIRNYIANRAYDRSVKLCQAEILMAQQRQDLFTEANLYVALAKTYYHLKQLDKAIYYNKQGLKIATEHHYSELLKRCHHNLAALSLEGKPDYKAAEHSLLKAIAYGRDIPQSKDVNLGQQYRLLGTVYDLLQDYHRADSIFTITEQIYQTFGDSLGLSDALTFHARVFLSQKKHAQAMAFVERALNYARPTKNRDYIQTALSMYEQILVAQKYYEKAYAVSKEEFYLNTEYNRQNLEEEIANSEARFRVAQLKNEQIFTETKARQTQRNYIFIFILFALLLSGSLFFVYQKRLASQQEKSKLASLKQVYEAEENERIRIAKDLHDNMGSYATSLLSQIEAIEYASDKTQQTKITDLKHDADNIMATLRETIWILNNKEITCVTFLDLVKNYANKQLVKNLSIEVSYTERLTHEHILSASTSLHLYRIIQESIQNIIKHANSRRVSFRFESTTTGLTIDIFDHGLGFDIAEQGHRSGLDNMEQRAGEIDFHYTIISSPGHGTQIILSGPKNTPE